MVFQRKDINVSCTDAADVGDLGPVISMLVTYLCHPDLFGLDPKGTISIALWINAVPYDFVGMKILRVW